MATRRGPDNSARISIQYTISNLTAVNVFWVQLSTSSSISQSDLDAYLVAFSNQYKTSFAPRMQTGVSYKLAQATCFTPGGSVLQSSATMTGTGSNAGTLVQDISACSIVSWLTTVYWRGGKPRTYIGGLSGAQTNGANQLTGAEVTALQTAGAGFRTAVNALTQGTITGTQFGFVSFQTGNAPRPSPLFFAIIGAKVHPRLGSQRRRLGKWVV